MYDPVPPATFGAGQTIAAIIIGAVRPEPRADVRSGQRGPWRPPASSAGAGSTKAPGRDRTRVGQVLRAAILGARSLVAAMSVACVRAHALQPRIARANGEAMVMRVSVLATLKARHGEEGLPLRVRHKRRLHNPHVELRAQRNQARDDVRGIADEIEANLRMRVAATEQRVGGVRAPQC